MPPKLARRHQGMCNFLGQDDESQQEISVSTKEPKLFERFFCFGQAAAAESPCRECPSFHVGEKWRNERQS
jgi:hypothetical protein